MILYHGSNVDIQNISLSACRPYKDFGRGFYLIDIPEQAERMAERVARIYGGEPVLYIYIKRHLHSIHSIHLQLFHY
ncbi:DUF3990 domain-containing protein [Butyrivibrio sp. INlla16]|uniref:DUF3990 domain-containing protein n=1 Tax=Butyrivibrio sp. INlla16 TaxID=1520807 RepID=UPI00088DAF74|nr:DUF3990 domain-containing protein [Butyrivibrio sp. INlla16]SDB26072.1 Protein of unknown function [Butyrivibrio sp. INlla16]